MPRARTTLETTPQLLGEDAEQAWKAYELAFSGLATRAVQQHLMTREEFDEVCTDGRWIKYVTRDLDRDGAVCAFATFTNDLSAVYQLSEDYYANRWPQQFSRRSIWYIGCVGVHPSYRSSGVFVTLVEAMCRVVHEQGGIASLDICRYNEEALALPRLIGRIVQSFGHEARGEKLDVQTYWAYDFSRA
jgi:ribosomal protein S18 acetylase RimI-like enzyme